MRSLCRRNHDAGNIEIGRQGPPNHEAASTVKRERGLCWVVAVPLRNDDAGRWGKIPPRTVVIDSRIATFER